MQAAILKTVARRHVMTSRTWSCTSARSTSTTTTSPSIPSIPNIHHTLQSTLTIQSTLIHQNIQAIRRHNRRQLSPRQLLLRLLHPFQEILHLCRVFLHCQYLCRVFPHCRYLCRVCRHCRYLCQVCLHCRYRFQVYQRLRDAGTSRRGQPRATKTRPGTRGSGRTTSQHGTRTPSALTVVRGSQELWLTSLPMAPSKLDMEHTYRPFGPDLNSMCKEKSHWFYTHCLKKVDFEVRYPCRSFLSHSWVI